MFHRRIEQKPGAEWDSVRIKLETGLSQEQFDHIMTLCNKKLANLSDPVHHPQALSPKNVLLLTLKWLRWYPTTRALALEFDIAKGAVPNLIGGVLAILNRALAYLLKPGSLGRTRLRKGELKDTIMAVDTFPVCIPQPPKEERKKYFLYKKDHKTRYAWKVQLCSDLKGKIISVGDAQPYGQISDIRMLRESTAESLLGSVVSPSLVRTVERRWAEIKSQSNRETEADEEEKEDGDELEEPEEEDDDDEEDVKEEEVKEAKELYDDDHPHANKAIGDKAYQGHEFVYVPFKRYKAKRMTKKKKHFNKSIGSHRVIIENVNKRVEDFKVVGSIYRGDRDDKFVSLIVRVVASLYNLKLEKEPVRRMKKHRRI